MKKFIITLIVILSIMMLCSCDPTVKEEDKKPPLGYGIDEEKQFLRLTNGGEDSLTVFHMLLRVDKEANFHMEKPLEDYHDYTSIFEEFEWAVEHAPCKTPPKKTFKENYIMIEGFADNGEYEAFIFCKNNLTRVIGEDIRNGQFHKTFFNHTEPEGGRFYKECSFGPKFQLFESRMAKYN